MFGPARLLFALALVASAVAGCGGGGGVKLAGVGTVASVARYLPEEP